MQGLPRGVKRQTKRLAADGSTAEYFYWRKTGERLPDPQAEPEKFAAAVKRCQAGQSKAAKPQRRQGAGVGTIGAVLIERQHSPEYKRLAASTQRMYSYDMARLAKLMPGFHELALDVVDRPFVRQIRDRIAETSPGYANRIVFAIGALFAFAIDRDHPISVNPAHGIKQLPSTPHQRWTDEQVAFAEAHLPGYFARGVTLAVQTGQRGGDLATLRWRAYDGQFLRLVQEKTGTLVELPVGEVPDLKAMLDQWKAENEARKVPSLTILNKRNGTPWANSDSYLWSMCRVFDKHPELDALTLHGLRHTFVARAVERGASHAQIKAWTGQKSNRMVDLYAKQARQVPLAVGLAKLMAGSGR